MNTNQQPFAFFDFDGTLTRYDTVLPFCHFVEHNSYSFIKKLLPISPYLIGYLLGIVSNLQAKEKLFTSYLAKLTLSESEKLAQQFVQQKLNTLLRSEGMQKLHYHQRHHHRCILVSASPELYLIDWAKQNGFECVLATQLEHNNGMLTGKISGKNCIGIEKVNRIEQIFGTQCWQNSYGYSDSLVDKPLLQAVEHSFLWKNNSFQPFTG